MRNHLSWIITLVSFVLQAKNVPQFGQLLMIEKDANNVLEVASNRPQINLPDIRGGRPVGNDADLKKPGTARRQSRNGLDLNQERGNGQMRQRRNRPEEQEQPLRRRPRPIPEEYRNYKEEQVERRRRHQMDTPPTSPQRQQRVRCQEYRVDEFEVEPIEQPQRRNPRAQNVRTAAAERRRPREEPGERGDRRIVPQERANPGRPIDEYDHRRRNHHPRDNGQGRQMNLADSTPRDRRQMRERQRPQQRAYQEEADEDFTQEYYEYEVEQQEEPVRHRRRQNLPREQRGRKERAEPQIQARNEQQIIAEALRLIQMGQQAAAQETAEPQNQDQNGYFDAEQSGEVLEYYNGNDENHIEDEYEEENEYQAPRRARRVERVHRAKAPRTRPNKVDSSQKDDGSEDFFVPFPLWMDYMKQVETPSLEDLVFNIPSPRVPCENKNVVNQDLRDEGVKGFQIKTSLAS